MTGGSQTGQERVKETNRRTICGPDLRCVKSSKNISSEVSSHWVKAGGEHSLFRECEDTGGLSQHHLQSPQTRNQGYVYSGFFLFIPSLRLEI